MKYSRGKKKNQKAQTVIELAVFGAVVIFMIGVIVNASVNYNYFQNNSLKAMRMAMTISFIYSEGLPIATGILNRSGVSSSNPGGRDGTASRNTATVILIEDRLRVGSTAQGTTDRLPLLNLGSGTFSRNLLMPVEFPQELPRLDIFMNGQHFPLMTSALRDHNFREFQPEANADGSFPETRNWNPPGGECGCPAPGCQKVWEVVQNHPGFEDWDPTCATCFDFDRDGNIDVPGIYNTPRSEFSYQWKEVCGTTAGVEGKVVDINDDGVTDRILDITSTVGPAILRAKYVDNTKGDFAFGFIGRKGDTIPDSGLMEDVTIFTYVESDVDGSDRGTYLEVREGKLFTSGPFGGRQVVRTTQRKDQIDIIQRQIQLANNTGRFCPENAGTPPSRVDEYRNPVKVCVETNEDCFTDTTIQKTCMNVRTKLIFVRSRLIDQRGRKWLTDIDYDVTVDFVVPPVN